MATIKLFFSIICFAFVSGNGMLGGNLLRAPQITYAARAGSNTELPQRSSLVGIARGELGVREQTGNNDGPRVESYLRSVGLKKGQAWCAAFVSWIYAQAGFAKPRSGWSPDLFPSSRLARSALPGDVLGIYFKAYKRIAHVGLVIKQDGDWMLSVEGNTNLEGSREGQGVYLKKRHRKTICAFSDWLKNGRMKNEN
jgi:cell wall-associated NlpC family hydrolase